MLERPASPSQPATADHDTGRPITPISVANINYTAGNRTLLHDIDLVIPAHSKTIIMGPNGAGKSLLVRILHGLIPPSHGTILWNGQPADAQTRARQAMVFQRPALLRRSALGNILFALHDTPRKHQKHKAHQLLKTANLSDHAKTPARLLSGGEQQRLALARAMARDPQVLFLDEPTSALDPSSTHAVEKMIEAAHDRGVKIVLITHNIGQAKRLGDDIAFLQNGRLMEHGPAEAFFATPQTKAAQAYLNGELYLP